MTSVNVLVLRLAAVRWFATSPLALRPPFVCSPAALLLVVLLAVLLGVLLSACAA